MGRRFLGVRWWLGAAFAVVAALSTAIVVSQYSSRSESALRTNGLQEAVSAAFSAAIALDHSSLRAVSQHYDLQLAQYDADGKLVAGNPSPLDRPAILADRYRGSTDNGRVFIVGVPFRGGTLVARDVRPDVQAAIGILNDQALRAGVIAGLIGVGYVARSGASRASATACACSSSGCTRASSPSTSISSCGLRTPRHGGCSADG
jgi:hypothetical protein